MTRFLSPEWVEEFNTALVGVVLPSPGAEAGLGAAGGTFTVVQEIGGTPDGDVRLTLKIDDGSLCLRVTTRDEAGSAPDAVNDDSDVTIALSYADAAAMSRGDLHAADALTAGRIRVRGDLAVLVATQEVLGAARASTQVTRSGTTY